MLRTFVVISFLQFSILYPLFIWTHFRTPIKRSFYQFTLALSNVMASFAFMMLLAMEVDLSLFFILGLWIGGCLLASFFFWNTDHPSMPVFSIPFLCGLPVYLYIHHQLLGTLDFAAVMGSLLGGVVLSGTIYVMILGHWYLNVPKLPIRCLRHAVLILAVFLVLRLVWSAVACVQISVVYFGDWIPLYQYAMQMDGIFLWIAVMFGALFPLVLIYLAKRTLDVKSTQSATGILYVACVSVLIGEFAYKYHLIGMGIAV